MTNPNAVEVDVRVTFPGPATMTYAVPAGQLIAEAVNGVQYMLPNDGMSAKYVSVIKTWWSRYDRTWFSEPDNQEIVIFIKTCTSSTTGATSDPFTTPQSYIIFDICPLLI
jgi:hypothetical protein